LTHLFDTSAFLIYFFGEPGAEKLARLLGNEDSSAGLCAITATEFWASLKAEKCESSFLPEWKACRPLFELVSVDESVALRAAELRAAASERLPTVDSLIAACASLHDAVLVHRDPHFQSLPATLLRQEYIEDNPA